MNYKEKYEAALERAREIKSKILSSHLSTESCKAVSEYIDEIIPELFESEDEKLRRGLITFLNLSEVSNKITFEAKTKWIELLEKQKELFKDGTGLYYYNGEKTTYCGYPATEDNPYDFAISQQKEQKPVDIELIQRSWYMEGYHDREFGKEPKWIIKTGEGGPKHELNPKYGEYIKKEQKPNIEICPHSTKSKFYKESFYPIEDCDYGLEIAYDILEKTFGEVRGYQTDDGIREHQTAIEAVRKAKEQKPVLKAENDNWYICIKDFYAGGKKWASVGDLIQAKNGMYMMGRDDISEWFRRAYFEEVRDAFEPNVDTNIPEQKPVEKNLDEFVEFFTKRAKEYEINLPNRHYDIYAFCKDLYSFVPKKKPVEKQDYSGLNDLERAIHRGFLCAGVENVPVEIIKETAKECLAQMKPAEWSEEDEEKLDAVINFLFVLDSYIGDDCTISDDKTTEARDAIQKVLVPWLKSFPERFSPQPKQEWSEEEKQKLNRIYSIIGWAMDEHAFSSCKKLIGDKEGVELQDFLRAIAKPESQPQWKPSEEQMDELRRVLIPGETFDCDILIGLLERLEELM